jgi:hypothetical protein
MVETYIGSSKVVCPSRIGSNEHPGWCGASSGCSGHREDTEERWYDDSLESHHFKNNKCRRRGVDISWLRRAHHPSKSSLSFAASEERSAMATLVLSRQ